MISLLLVASLSTTAKLPQADTLIRFTFTEYHMGIDARIVLYAANKTVAESACEKAFARLGELDQIMSDYKKDSELMQLCDRAGGPPVKISKDLMTVFKRAQDVSMKTDGAFDITIGPLVLLWRKARKSKVIPEESEIKTARALVGYRKLVLDEKSQTAKLLVKGMKLDLGGIAKGYAADEMHKVLKANGVNRALIELGGDVVMSGPPPKQEGWSVRVPNGGDDQGPIDIKAANVAISTSGDTEQGVVIGGKMFSHVVNPRTGYALTNRIQATVIGENGFFTDPISKVFALMPREAAVKLMKSYPKAKYYIKVLPTPK